MEKCECFICLTDDDYQSDYVSEVDRHVSYVDHAERVTARMDHGCDIPKLREAFFEDSHSTISSPSDRVVNENCSQFASSPAERRVSQDHRWEARYARRTDDPSAEFK